MKWTRPLAIATVVFASTTAYFAYELEIERDGSSGVAAGGSVSSAAAPAGTAVPTVAPGLQAPLPQASVTQPDKSLERVAAAPRLPTKEERLAMAQARLDAINDPRKRAEGRDRRLSYLRDDVAAPAKYLHFTREQVEGLAEILDEQSTRHAVSNLRCELEPGCTVDPLKPRFDEADRVALAQVLGEKKADAFIASLENSVERGQVERFRERLPKQNDLSDEQEDRLVSALAEERRQLMETVRRDNNSVLVLEQLKAIIPRGASDPAAYALESAREFGHRLRERAAPILTPAQFAAYDEMLDEELRRLSTQKGN